MKKVMAVLFGLGLVCTVQAATWTWKMNGTVYTPGDSTTTLASGTAYLFDSASTSQSALLALFQGGTSDISGKAVSTAPTLTVSSGISSSASATFDYGAVASYDYYTAIVSGDYIYIGATKTAAGLAVGSTLISLASNSTPSKSTFDSTVTTYGTAGWYTAAPEPASIGLLMLGLCALGLKRKIA